MTTASVDPYPDVAPPLGVRQIFCWLQQVMSNIGPEVFTDEELAALLTLMAPLCHREIAIPANVVHLKPRAKQNQMQPARG